MSVNFDSTFGFDPAVQDSSMAPRAFMVCGAACFPGFTNATNMV